MFCKHAPHDQCNPGEGCNAPTEPTMEFAAKLTVDETIDIIAEALLDWDPHSVGWLNITEGYKQRLRAQAAYIIRGLRLTVKAIEEENRTCSCGMN